MSAFTNWLLQQAAKAQTGIGKTVSKIGGITSYIPGAPADIRIGGGGGLGAAIAQGVSPKQATPYFSTARAAEPSGLGSYGEALYSPVMASYPTGTTTSAGSTGTTYPTTTTPTGDLSGNQDLGLVNAGWEEARKYIEAQNPILDQSYALSKGDIEGGITSAEQAGTRQTEDLSKRYGSILANQLRTYQDLGRQRQGVFSSLGTLESSAFGEQQARADQSLGEGRLATEQNQATDIKSVQDTVNSYKQQAQSELGRLALQYQQGKQAISSALANNDIQAAASIKDTIDQIRNRALTISSLLSGTLSSISGVTGEGYATNVAKQLASVTSSGNALYTLPATSTTGEGFIAPDGKKYKNYLEYLNSFGQATL